MSSPVPISPETLEGRYDPQPILQLRERFSKATDHVHFVNDDIRKPKSEWAANDPAHVFDFKDGMRLIVSRDSEERSHPDVFSPAVTIHVSASIRPDGELMIVTPLSRSEWQQQIISHLELISNFVGGLVDSWISDPPKRVLHLWFKE